MIKFFKEIKEEAKEWAYGRFWLFRAILIFYFVYVFIRHLISPEYTSLFGGINLGIHELGHILFYPLGEFLSVLGGSLLQVAVPLISFLVFYKQKDYFAYSVSFFWLSTSLFNLSLYISDARKQALPLVSPFSGEEIIHDWNYILSKLGLLSFDTFFSYILRFFAILFMFFGILWGIYIIKFMLFKKITNLKS